MVIIKEFIDKVSHMDSRSKRDLILSSHEARMLRDEIVKLMAENLEKGRQVKVELSSNLEISGGKW